MRIRAASEIDEIFHQQASERASPEERFSHDFLINSGRTKGLQAGILVSLVAVLVVITTQELLQKPTGQTVQRSG